MDTLPTATPATGGSKTLRIALIALFSVIAVVGGYLIIDYVRKNRKEDKKKEKDAAAAAALALAALGLNSTNSTEGDEVTVGGTTYTNTGSAISYGSYGDNVMALQAGLIDVYGRGALPTHVLPIHGADGSWGAETQAALVAKVWAKSYADLDAIEAQIAAKKPSSTVVTAINNATTGTTTGGIKYYYLKAKNAAEIHDTANSASKVWGKVDSGGDIGWVAASVYNGKKNAGDWIPVTIIGRTISVGNPTKYVQKWDTKISIEKMLTSVSQAANSNYYSDIYFTILGIKIYA